jgi:nitronate monooxygenase
MNFGGGEGAKKAWKDIWGAGQGVGAVKEVVPARVFIERLRSEVLAAKAQLCAA